MDEPCKACDGNGDTGTFSSCRACNGTGKRTCAHERALAGRCLDCGARYCGGSWVTEDASPAGETCECGKPARTCGLCTENLRRHADQSTPSTADPAIVAVVTRPSDEQLSKERETIADPDFARVIMCPTCNQPRNAKKRYVDKAEIADALEKANAVVRAAQTLREEMQRASDAESARARAECARGNHMPSRPGEPCPSCRGVPLGGLNFAPLWKALDEAEKR